MDFTEEITEENRDELLRSIGEGVKGFLSREKPKEEFGKGRTLEILSFSMGAVIDIIPDLPNPQQEIEGLGYKTLEELKSAYQEAVDHYGLPKF